MFCSRRPLSLSSLGPPEARPQNSTIAAIAWAVRDNAHVAHTHSQTAMRPRHNGWLCFKASCPFWVLASCKTSTTCPTAGSTSTTVTLSSCKAKETSCTNDIHDRPAASLRQVKFRGQTERRKASGLLAHFKIKSWPMRRRGTSFSEEHDIPSLVESAAS